MLKIFRCENRKKRYRLENQFGFGACDDLKKLRKGLSYSGNETRYPDRMQQKRADSMAHLSVDSIIFELKHKIIFGSAFVRT